MLAENKEEARQSPISKSEIPYPEGSKDFKKKDLSFEQKSDVSPKEYTPPLDMPNLGCKKRKTAEILPELHSYDRYPYNPTPGVPQQKLQHTTHLSSLRNII